MKLTVITNIFSASVFMRFILPALLIAVIAGALAFFLAFLGQKMAVARDERIDEVKNSLSGANCGGCGYAGCDAFAEALVKGEADISRCNATSKKGKAAIAAILGVRLAEDKKTVAFVACNGGNACLDRFDYQGYGDCRSAEALAGGSKACDVGCMGLGSCSKACPHGALSVDKDSAVAKVDYAYCTSCGACIATCPKSLIVRVPADAVPVVACSNKCKAREVASVCKNGCIACGKCARTCPSGAITIIDNLAVIDYDKCIGCGGCVDACPRKCIHRFPDHSTVQKSTE